MTMPGYEAKCGEIVLYNGRHARVMAVQYGCNSERVGNPRYWGKYYELHAQIYEGNWNHVYRHAGIHQSKIAPLPEIMEEARIVERKPVLVKG